MPHWLPACSTPGSRSAARSASPCSATVAWTVVANSIHAQGRRAAAAAQPRPGQPIHAAAGGHLPAAIYNHALSVGFSRGFLVSAIVAALGFLVTLVMIRVKRSGPGRCPGDGWCWPPPRRAASRGQAM